MRDLRINPTGHEIECTIEELNAEDGYASVSIQLYKESDEPRCRGAVSASEALKISKWFADLAKELTPKKVKKTAKKKADV